MTFDITEEESPPPGFDGEDIVEIAADLPTRRRMIMRSKAKSRDVRKRRGKQSPLQNGGVFLDGVPLLFGGVAAELGGSAAAFGGVSVKLSGISVAFGSVAICPCCVAFVLGGVGGAAARRSSS